MDSPDLVLYDRVFEFYDGVLGPVQEIVMKNLKFCKSRLICEPRAKFGLDIVMKCHDFYKKFRE